MTITEQDLRACHVRETDHYNGGAKFFGYGGKCVEHPRLYRLVKYFKKDRSTQITWQVDGAEVKDLAEAAERLNVPPTMTDAEREVYERVPLEMTRCRDEQYPWEIMHSLSRKGLLEYEDGKCRRVPTPSAPSPAATAGPS